MTRSSRHIQFIWAFFLLLIFTLGNMPKVFLHDLTSNHKDEIVIILSDLHDQHVHEQGFSCDTNDIVCTSPFIESEPVFIASPVTCYFTIYPIPSFIVHSRNQNQFLLRGPPFSSPIS